MVRSPVPLVAWRREDSGRERPAVTADQIKIALVGVGLGRLHRVVFLDSNARATATMQG